MTVKDKFKDAVKNRTLELFASCGPEYGQCAQLSRKLDVKACTIRKWKSLGCVSIEGATLVEKKIGGKFTAHYLRPDFYGKSDKPGNSGNNHGAH